MARVAVPASPATASSGGSPVRGAYEALRRLAERIFDTSSPFLWVVLAPLITVPVTGLLLVFALDARFPPPPEGSFAGTVAESRGGAAAEEDFGGLTQDENCFREEDYGTCRYYYSLAPVLLIFAIPGLLHLLPVLGLRYARDAHERAQAGAAIAWGAIRFVLPFAVLLISFGLAFSGGAYLEVAIGASQSPDVAVLYDVWQAGIVAWGLSALTWVAWPYLPWS